LDGVGIFAAMDQVAFALAASDAVIAGAAQDDVEAAAPPGCCRRWNLR